MLLCYFPSAHSSPPVKILLFYIGGTLAIGVLVPSNDPGLNLKDKNAAASPFVIAIQHAGIKSLPSVISQTPHKCSQIT